MFEFRDVSLHFGTQDVLRHVGFRINKGEHVGIVGPNGAGKSTVFQLITGELTPAHGQILFDGKPRIGHLHQQLHPHNEGDSLLSYALRAIPRLETIEQEIHALEAQLADIREEAARARILNRLGECQTEFEHLGGYDIETRIKAALGGLGFHERDFSRPFTEFSGGWQMRAELARTITAQPDLLLLDEPSNYLDLPAVEWVQRFLREFQGTILLISHDRYLLRTLTSLTLEVDAGAVNRYQGGLDYYMRERETRHASLLASKANQDRRRQQIESFVNRFRATSTKASQVQSRIKELDRMETIHVPKQASTTGHIRIAPPPHCGSEVLRLEEAGFCYTPEAWIFRQLSVSIDKGDRVAIVGYNGMGKTTLLRVMAEVRSPCEGRRVLGHKVIPGYLSQEFSETIPDGRSVLNVVKEAAPDRSEGDTRSLLGSFGFSGDDVQKPAGVLSGGEKIRLAFARLFANPPNLLLLDEPTTHLDLNGRRTLEEALKHYAGTVCFVSHDVEFTRAIATRVIDINDTGVRLISGGYDYYVDKLQTTAASSRAPAGNRRDADAAGTGQSRKEQRKARVQQRAKRQPRIRELRRRLQAAEARVAELELEQQALVDSLSQGDLAGADYADSNRRLTALQTDLATVNHLWEQAALELEQLEAPDNGQASDS